MCGSAGCVLQGTEAVQKAKKKGRMYLTIFAGDLEECLTDLVSQALDDEYVDAAVGALKEVIKNSKGNGQALSKVLGLARKQAKALGVSREKQKFQIIENKALKSEKVKGMRGKGFGWLLGKGFDVRAEHMRLLCTKPD